MSVVLSHAVLLEPWQFPSSPWGGPTVRIFTCHCLFTDSQWSGHLQQSTTGRLQPHKCSFGQLWRVMTTIMLLWVLHGSSILFRGRCNGERVSHPSATFSLLPCWLVVQPSPYVASHWRVQFERSWPSVSRVERWATSAGCYTVFWLQWITAHLIHHKPINKFCVNTFYTVTTTGTERAENLRGFIRQIF
jgi:hypothetical protein